MELPERQEAVRAKVREYESRRDTVEAMVKKAASATEVATWRAGIPPGVMRSTLWGLGFRVELRHRVGYEIVAALRVAAVRGYSGIIGAITTTIDGRRVPGPFTALFGVASDSVHAALVELEHYDLVRRYQRFTDGGGVIDSRGIKLGRRYTTTLYSLGPAFELPGLRSLVDRAIRQAGKRHGFGTAQARTPRVRSLLSTAPNPDGSHAATAAWEAIDRTHRSLGSSSYPEATPEEAQTPVRARAREEPPRPRSDARALADEAEAQMRDDARRRLDERLKEKRARAQAVVSAVRERWDYRPPHPNGCECKACSAYAQRTLFDWAGRGP